MNACDDLLTIAGHVDDLSPRQQERAFVPVAAALRSLPAAPVPGRRRLAGLRGRLVLVGAVTVAAGLLAVPVLSIGNRQPAAEASAATLLRAAGNAAGAQQGGWPNAAYWHVASVYREDGHLRHREIWMSHHGQSVLRDQGLGPGVIPLGHSYFSGLTWDQLYALPTDPAKLKPMLKSRIKGAGPNPTFELFVAVGDLLRESPAPPALRKALYDIAAEIPGVHVIRHVKDALGRTGTGFERDGETLVIDQKTGELLADNRRGWSDTTIRQGPASTAPRATTK